MYVSRTPAVAFTSHRVRFRLCTRTALVEREYTFTTSRTCWTTRLRRAGYYKRVTIGIVTLDLDFCLDARTHARACCVVNTRRTCISSPTRREHASRSGPNETRSDRRPRFRARNTPITSLRSIAEKSRWLELREVVEAPRNLLANSQPEIYIFSWGIMTEVIIYPKRSQTSNGRTRGGERERGRERVPLVEAASEKEKTG